MRTTILPYLLEPLGVPGTGLVESIFVNFASINGELLANCSSIVDVNIDTMVVHNAMVVHIGSLAVEVLFLKAPISVHLQIRALAFRSKEVRLESVEKCSVCIVFES